MKSPEARKAWALQACLAMGMRLTPIRDRILTYLARQRVPVSLETMIRAEEVRGICDLATAYRTLMVLRGMDVIRQVSLPDKISYFVLHIPGESTPFLVCRCCGAIHDLPAAEVSPALEQKVATSQGYAGVYHELVFYGVCPTCQTHPPGVVCAKVQPRMRLGGGFKVRAAPSRSDRNPAGSNARFAPSTPEAAGP